MENETMLKEILHAFRLHAVEIEEKFDDLKTEMDEKFNAMKSEMNEKFDAMKSEMDNGFNKVNERLDRITNKQDVLQADQHDTKETVNFLHAKVVQHEQKLHQLAHQQQ